MGPGVGKGRYSNGRQSDSSRVRRPNRRQMAHRVHLAADRVEGHQIWPGNYGAVQIGPPQKPGRQSDAKQLQSGEVRRPLCMRLSLRLTNTAISRLLLFKLTHLDGTPGFAIQ